MTRTNKIKLIQSAGSRCAKCGYGYNGTNPHHFEFHHLDPAEKQFVIGEVKGVSFATILNETQKCELLCKFCHADVHHDTPTIGRSKRRGCTPLGYRTLEDGTIVVDEAEMATVKRARQLRECGYNLREICTLLTDEGRRTKRGGQWGPANVWLLLKPRWIETHELVPDLQSSLAQYPLFDNL